MKSLLLLLGVFILGLPQVEINETVFLGRTISTGSFVEHSGGCRKSSPPGQCCHAGSKPLHCH